MPKIRTVDFSGPEWIEGTSELTYEEEGLYIDICALIYSRGSGVGMELILSRKKCRADRVRKLHARLISLGKVYEKSGITHVKRCDVELLRATSRIDSSHLAAAKRWENNGLINATASCPQDANHQPPTTNHQKEEKGLSVERPKRAAKPRASKHPFPNDWVPDEQDRRYAAQKGYDAPWVDDQAERCRDHHVKHGNWFVDDHAVWRTWVQNAQNFSRQPPMLNGKQNGRSPGEKLFEGAWRAAEAFDARQRAGGAIVEPLLDSE
jgi:hypothetical protein